MVPANGGIFGQKFRSCSPRPGGDDHQDDMPVVLVLFIIQSSSNINNDCFPNDRFKRLAECTWTRLLTKVLVL